LEESALSSLFFHRHPRPFVVTIFEETCKPSFGTPQDWNMRPPKTGTANWSPPENSSGDRATVWHCAKPVPGLPKLPWPSWAFTKVRLSKFLLLTLLIGLYSSIIFADGFMESLDNKYIYLRNDSQCIADENAPATLGLKNMAGENRLLNSIKKNFLIKKKKQKKIRFLQAFLYWSEWESQVESF
jgi:hypothetical protein